jgi:hypothetical protein
MRTIVLLAGAAAALVASSLASTPATAANVIFVSATNGNDSACQGDGSSPCRTLGYALSLAGSGDIVQLETGGNYGPATVTQSVTIFSPHGAAIFGFGPCLTINAGSSDVVTLDGIVCIPAPFPSERTAGAMVDTGAPSGIIFNSGEKLRIRNSRIHGAGGGNCGVLFQPNSKAELHIEHSVISENGFTGNGGGVCVLPTGNAVVTGVIDDLTAQNDRTALRAAGSNLDLLVQNSTFSNNLLGIRVIGSSSTIRISNSVVFKNTTGINSLSGGQLVSFGGNVLAGNTTDGAFTSTEAKQ